MPALRTNTASGCWREVRRERESERRDGTAATNEFRQLPKIRPEIHHWRFPPISNLHSPGPKPPRHRSSLVDVKRFASRKTRREDRPEKSRVHRANHSGPSKPSREAGHRENFAGTETRRAGRREGSRCEATPEGPARGVLRVRRARGRGRQRSRWALIGALAN